MGIRSKKRASELRVGDKILGNTNHFEILAIRQSPLTGVTYPILDVVDAHGVTRTLETGKDTKTQDLEYEVEAPEVK